MTEVKMGTIYNLKEQIKSSNGGEWVPMTEEESKSMPKVMAKRDNKGKPEMHYWDLFPKVAEAFSRVMEYGGSKYEYLNFAKGCKPDQEYLDSARRHHLAHCKKYISGDQTDMYDTESGCLHLAHELFNLFALIEYNLGDLPVRNIVYETNNKTK